MTSSTPVNLVDLIDSWTINLRADRKSLNTIKLYTTGARYYLRWCEDNDLPSVLSKQLVNRWIAELLDGGAQDATVASRQLGVRRFAAWLVDEDILDENPLSGLTRPKLDTKVVDPFTRDEVKALITACSGKDFRARRDEAMIRVFAETGCRAAELLGMELDDVDVKTGTAVVRRGKGGKGRKVPIGPQTCRSVDRYLRLRRNHRLAASPTLWLGDRNRNLSYNGMRLALIGRAEAAEVKGFHVHRFRHTLADRWLDAGGSEGGLMSVAGWSDPTMLRRYAKARAEQRAAEEARRLNLGDL